MNSIVVSIVIPVYNAEKYIKETIDSILEVKSHEIEVITVDDGSSDASLAILQSYEKKDSRIKVIHKENGGASSARNAGIAVASGEYLYFEDADDPVISDSLSHGVELCKLQKYDWIIFEYERGKKQRTQSDKNREFSCEDLWLFEKLYTTSDLNSACGKFYRKNVIESNTLFFNEGIIYGEDLLFNLYFSEKIKMGVSVDKNIFIYRDTPESVMNSFNYQRLDDTLAIIDEKCSLLKKKIIDEKSIVKAYSTMRNAEIKNVIEQAFIKGDYQKRRIIKRFINDERLVFVMKEWRDQLKYGKNNEESVQVMLWNYALYKKNYIMVVMILNLYSIIHHNRWK